jgi:hypothetical protein
MTHVLQPFHLLVIALADWLERHQQAVIDYLTPKRTVFLKRNSKDSGFGSPTNSGYDWP